MADNIVVSYQDNLDQLIRDLKIYREQQLGLNKNAEDFGKKSKAAGIQAATATKEAGTQAAQTGNLFGKLGGAIAAAFSTAAVIAFGKATVDAFIKAELSAKKLQTAVGAGGGLTRDFNVLLQQSKELQKTTIFNDETIQDAQTMALQFGLNAQAVKDLIPLIIDFASATGQDLGSALSTVLRGTTGQTRGLKVYGIEVSASATRTEKFASIVQQLTDKFQGQGKIVGETVGGRLKQLSNAWDELKESIGGALAPLVSGAAALAKSLLGITETSLSKKLQDEQLQLELTSIKLSSLNEGSKERSLIIAQLQAQYPGYLDNIKGEELSNEALQKALRRVNDQLVLKIALAKGDEGIVEAQEKVADALLKTSKQEGILISQIRQRLEQVQKSNPVLAEQLRTTLQGLSLDEQAAVIREKGLDVSGKIIESIGNRTKADGELKKAQDELTKAQQKRITEEERLRGILNIPVTEEKLSTGGDFLKKTEEEIKAEEAAAKKIQDAKEKAAKEAADAVAKINEDNFKLAEDNLKKFQAEQISLIENQNISREEKEKAFAQLELDVLNARRQNYIDYGKDVGDIDVQIATKRVETNKTKEKSDKDVADKAEKLRREGLKDAIEKEGIRLKEEEDAAEKRKKIMQEVFDLAAELSQSLNDLFDAQNEQDLERINSNRDEEIEAIDEQIEALEEANDRGKLSDKKLEQQKKQLLEQRAAAEKRAAEETRQVKIKQAEQDKALTIFRIALILAEALARIPEPTAIIQSISAAAQLAVAIATPVPAFKRGTKGKKETGVGLVGEEGPEFVWMDKGAKVVPAPQTRKYREAIDSMIEGTFDEKYVYKAMIASALREASKQAEKQKQKTFAENVANLFNVKAEIDPYRLADGIKSNNKELAWHIGKAVAKQLKQNNSNDRYYH